MLQSLSRVVKAGDVVDEPIHIAQRWIDQGKAEFVSVAVKPADVKITVDKPTKRKRGRPRKKK